MLRTIRAAVAAGAVVLAIALPVGALAAPSPTLLLPPGCTGGWNTMQAAVHNHAPGLAPGCAVAESHAR